MPRKLKTSPRRGRKGGEGQTGPRKDRRASSDLTRTETAARHRQPPTTGLFVSTDAKLGDEEEVFRDLER